MMRRRRRRWMRMMGMIIMLIMMLIVTMMMMTMTLPTDGREVAHVPRVPGPDVAHHQVRPRLDPRGRHLRPHL
jgi:hypothetical protein